MCVCGGVSDGWFLQLSIKVVGVSELQPVLDYLYCSQQTSFLGRETSRLPCCLLSVLAHL